MGRPPLLLGLVILLAAANANAADQILTLDGLGLVRIGMTQAQAEAALGTTLKSVYPNAKKACWFGNRTDGVDGQISYMIENGEVARIEISDHEWPKSEEAVPSVATERGIRIHSSREDVKKAYGSRLGIRPHPQGNAGDENYLYLEVLSSDKQRGLLFEIWEGKVNNFRAGTAQAFSLDEPCI